MKKKLGAGLLIGLGLVIVLIFGFRLARAIRHWGGPPRPQPRATITDVELIRDWMTIPYLAHTYGVPDPYLFNALNIPEGKNRKRSLADINAQYFPGQDGFVLLRLQEAISSFQNQVPLPPLPPPAPAVPSAPIQ